MAKIVNMSNFASKHTLVYIFDPRDNPGTVWTTATATTTSGQAPWGGPFGLSGTFKAVFGTLPKLVGTCLGRIQNVFSPCLGH